MIQLQKFPNHQILLLAIILLVIILMSLSSLEIKTALVSLQFISTNSVRNKFESLADLASANLDVLTSSQSQNLSLKDFQKITALTVQKMVQGFSYVRKDIPAKFIKGITVSNSFEGLFIELNLRNKKWLLGRLHNVHRDNIISHLGTISNVLDKLCKGYENLILLGYFCVKT